MEQQKHDVVYIGEEGCLVDGHWGQYGSARVIEIAADYGWDDAEAIDLAARHLASMGPSLSEDLSDDEYELLIVASDDAEAWLNDHVAAPDHFFGWNDGEFFYMSSSWWEETE